MKVKFRSNRGSIHIFGFIFFLGVLGAAIFIARSVEGRLNQADLQIQVLRQQVTVLDSRLRALEK